MSDGINIDFGPVANAKPFNAFMQGFTGAHQIALTKSQDEARADALAHPNDVNALAKLSIYDPVGAKGVIETMDRQRGFDTNAATANYVRSLNSFTPQIAPVSPVQGQQAAQAPNINQPGALPPVAPGASFAQAMAPVGQPGQQQQMDPQTFIAAEAPHMQQLGAAVAQGADPQEAFAKLVALSPETASNIVSTIGQMDTQRRVKLADLSNALGTVAQQLMGVPQGQRAAILTQSASYLQQHGVTVDQINQAIQGGLSDQQLQGFIGQAVGVTGMIEQANKDKSFAIEGMNAQTGMINARVNAQRAQYDMSRGVLDPSTGDIVNPVSGKVIYSADNSGGGGGDTLATRNNNPGNIKDGNYARNLPGYVGSEGGFAKFSSVQDGKNAQLSLLQSYIQRGIDTPTKIASRWAPSGDGNNNPTAYAQAIAQAAGIGVNDKIPDGKLTKIAEAQAQIEGFGGGPSGGSRVEDQAKAIADGRAPVLTGRAAVSGMGGRIMRRAYELNPQLDAKTYKPEEASLKSFTSGPDGRTVQAINNVTNHLAALRALADAQKNGNVPAFNAAANWYKKATGNPAPTNFEAAKQIIGAEIVKVIAGAGGALGDREEAAKVLNPNMSPQQINGVLDTIQGLVGSQVHTMQQKYEQGTGRQDFGRLVTDVVRKGFGIRGSGGGQSNVIRYDAQGNRIP